MKIKLRNMTSVYFVRDTEILCLYRIGSRVANKKFVGAAGGHFEPEELNDPYICILREMQEELGLLPSDVEELRLRYVTHRLMGDEIRQNYYFFGRLKENRELSSTEGELHWISFSDVPKLDMPLSAKHMILHYLEQGRCNETLYGGITEESGTNFIPMRSFE